MSSTTAEQTPLNGLAYPPFGDGDKYRGAVVEVRPAHASARERTCAHGFCVCVVGPAAAAGVCAALGRGDIPRDRARLRARLLTHPVRPPSCPPLPLPLPPLNTDTPLHPASVLDKSRKPIGYIDVAVLKKKWEAGEASPVRPLPLPLPTCAHHPPDTARATRSRRS